MFLKIIAFSFLALSLNAKANATHDHIMARASSKEGELHCEILTTNPKQQLSFLMQGLTLSVICGQDSVVVIFPDAMMVRNKVKHHPNEVKPTFKGDSIGEEIRPDLQPLIAALNDTTATITKQDATLETHAFDIDLNRETTELLFSVSIPWCDCDSDSITVKITSTPFDVHHPIEFSGRNLSDVKRKNPKGLGQAPTQQNSKNRLVNYNAIIKLTKK